MGNKRPESLFVSQTWQPLDHRVFLDFQRPKINRDTPGISIGWRKLGKAGAMLLRAGEFQDARMNNEGRGKLKYTPLNTIKSAIMKAAVGTEGSFSVTGTEFIGDRGVLDIGYVLEPTFLRTSKLAVRKVLEDINEHPIAWPEENPEEPEFYVSAATIPRNLARDHLLEAFRAVQPAYLPLLPPAVEKQ